MAQATKKRDITPAEPSRLTFATRVHEQLRRAIVAGEFPAGEKLRIQALCQQYGVGLSPMREALARLSREGLVQHSDQRGFSVRSIDKQHLEELTRTRCWLNGIGIRESILHGDEAWEENIVLAYHRMTRLRFEGDDGRSNPEWELAHRGFHLALISACRSRWLIQYCEQLFDAADFYRHVSRSSLVRAKVRNLEHDQILKAALARDVDTAVDTLVAHLQRTAYLVQDRVYPADVRAARSEP